MHKSYYEGILQLRNPTKEIIEFVKNQIKKKPDVLITAEKKVTNGIDLYMTSQKHIRIIGKRLKKNFCGELKVSSKLHTKNRQTSKNVYRINVLFRAVKCDVGDILTFKGDMIKILKLGKRILAKDLQTGKKLSITYKDL
jgi:NMD protein affecting ribosome stability and mRNA decay